MASQRATHDMITCFCEVYRVKISEELITAWENALGRFQDNQVIPAGQKLMEELHRMPTPADLIERIKLQDPLEDLQVAVEMMAHCTKCGKWRYCRKDQNHPRFECEDCYTGLTKDGRIARVKELRRMLSGITRKYGEAA